jgi:hypothetical protein
MNVSPGKVEARVASHAFSRIPEIRSEMHAFLNDRFLGVQVLAYRPYHLSNSRRTSIHGDGSRHVFIELKGLPALGGVGTVDIRVNSADGTVYDSKEERIAKKRKLAELVQLHKPSSPPLAAMLTSFKNAISDPQDELVHLYEVREAPLVTFGAKANVVIAKLGLNPSAWSRFGKLCNGEPLRQGRHRGKSVETLRDATHNELKEAREIAQSMNERYVHYLDANRES